MMMLTSAVRASGPKSVDHDTRSCTCHDYGSGQGQRVRRIQRRRENRSWRAEVADVIARGEWRA